MANDGSLDKSDDFSARHAGEPEPLRSYYLGGEVNQPVPLYDGPGNISWEQDKGFAPGHATVRLNWLPEPHLEVGFTSPNCRQRTLPDETRLTLPLGLGRSNGFGIEVPVEWLHLSVDDAQGLDGTFLIRQPVVIPLASTPDVGAAEWVEAHIVNCADFGGDRERSHTVERLAASYISGRTRFRVENSSWQCVIDPVSKAPYREAMLTQGYAVTHVADLRAVGQYVSAKQALAQAKELCDLLSLVSGNLVGCCLLTGYDSQGTAIWNVWNAPLAGPWRGRQSAIPMAAGTLDMPHNLAGPDFSRLSRRHQAIRSDEEGAALLDRLSEWYLTAVGGFGATEIILAAAGLELAAYQYLVLEQGMKNFDQKLDTADGLRLLLSAMGEPLAVPSTLPFLTALAAKGGRDWDGPDCVIQMRNALIHPPRQRKPRPFATDPEARDEAHALALHYLDLAVLRLLDYDGVCFDRTGGPGRSVPWSSDPTVPLSHTFR